MTYRGIESCCHIPDWVFGGRERGRFSEDIPETEVRERAIENLTQVEVVTSEELQIVKATGILEIPKIRP